MATPPGLLGNLTSEQEIKLHELWALTLKTFGVQDPHPTSIHPNGLSAENAASASESESPDKKRKSKRLSLFGRKHDDTATQGSPGKTGTEEDDKYGQTAELQKILASTPAETLRNTFWAMVKSDHPDALLLRFLRARKWDVDRALAMLISTMHWRSQDMHLDDDIMLNGEGGALIDESSSDSTIKKEGHDFLLQMRMGKSFIHGADKDGRPVTYVRARLHKSADQTVRALERYTVFVTETARLALRPPVETACIVFDMTDFTMANMDYTPVKFMIKIFEANYPESLGTILVHKAPWVFQGIWKIIKGWLDPVVAGKVHFTNTVTDMETYIARSQIIKELGGDENWEYKYVEGVPGENDMMKDTTTRDKLQSEYREYVQQYQRKTFDWIAAANTSKSADVQQLKAERDELAKRMNDNYWVLDPYVRSRSLYDRVGMIERGGKINFHPSHTLKKENLFPNAPSALGATPTTHDDDVD